MEDDKIMKNNHWMDKIKIERCGFIKFRGNSLRVIALSYIAQNNEY